MKQPIEISLAVVLAVVAGAVFWRQANLPKIDPCTSKCEAMATELRCSRGDKCAELCGTLRTATVCKPYVETFIQCFVKQPRSGWRCDEDGTPILRHVCEGEQNNIADCMLHNDRKL